MTVTFNLAHRVGHFIIGSRAPRPGWLLALCSLWLVYLPAASAVELSGQVDVRALREVGERSWIREGMGKTRYGGGSQLRLGQAILAAELELGDAVTAVAVINAYEDRDQLLDVQEAWLGWNPVPVSQWKVRVKAGLFFPPLNQEQDYDQRTWLPARTISASAVNSWVGEEMRSKGIEANLAYRGRASGSPHDLGVTAAAFNGNDPAGTLLAWRGWGVGDRITGVSESIRLADLPVYRADGPINLQTRDTHLFRELDGRAGYYVGVNYAYAGIVEVSAMHYDNRGDPLIVKAGQYSWGTRFNHAGMRLRTGQWEWMFQYLTGATAMGPRAAALDFRAWYALASRRVGAGTLTVRHDRFRAIEDDVIATDPNGERGSALAIAYTLDLSDALSVVSEVLLLRSERPARVLIGETPDQTSRSITTSLRWRF